jgi:hypothetical protein
MTIVMSTTTFTLITKKIFEWAPKVMRKVGMTSIHLGFLSILYEGRASYCRRHGLVWKSNHIRLIYLKAPRQAGRGFWSPKLAVGHGRTPWTFEFEQKPALWTDSLRLYKYSISQNNTYIHIHTHTHTLHRIDIRPSCLAAGGQQSQAPRLPSLLLRTANLTKSVSVDRPTDWFPHPVHCIRCPPCAPDDPRLAHNDRMYASKPTPLGGELCARWLRCCCSCKLLLHECVPL